MLGFGVLIVVAVYFYSRRDSSEPTEEDDAPLSDSRVEPTLGPAFESEPEPERLVTEPVASTDQEEPLAPEAEPQPVAPSPGGGAPQKIVTLRIVARDRGSFAGDKLILSLRGIGMRHGKFGIFHRFEGDESSATIFSAASLVEPGSFDLSNIKQQMIPGISMFAVFPGPIEGVEAFDLMMAAARAIAKAMDADLLDESGSTLSIQRERYLREEIIQFEHSLQVTH